MQLHDFSPSSPDEPIDLVFIHHSVGGQLLSDEGGEDGTGRAHPNGGGLRTLLTRSNYRVHGATRGSRLGEHTDLFDWLPKFRDEMPRILRVAEQDLELPEPRVNRVVAFKSCFPNNDFVAEGAEPGRPEGPALTLANAKASFRALLPLFARERETLFVFLTTPPLVRSVAAEPRYKWLAKKLLGRPTLERRAGISRQFNDWAASPTGWLAGHAVPNVLVLHYFDILAGGPASNFLAYPTGGGMDNHPSAAGNRRAASAFVPLLNRAVRRAGLVPTGLRGADT